jgi:SWI/SNF-related matrix-associated actin-dependent regulator 1 of chromatin subfamily A
LNEDIHISKGGDGVCKVRGVEKLDAERFIDYARSASPLGVRWIPQQGAEGPLESSLALMRSLQAKGFAISTPPGFVYELQNPDFSARVEEYDRSLLERTGRGLYPFQKADIQALQELAVGFNANPQGLGKTVEMLLAVHFFQPRMPVIVLCPANAKGVWEAESRIWTPDREVQVLYGKFNFEWPKENQTIVMGYTTLPKMMPPGVPKGTWLILDEFQACKNPKAQRTKATKDLIDLVLEHRGRVTGTTGTPIMNREMELWDLLGLLKLTKKVFSGVVHPTKGRLGPWDAFIYLFGGWMKVMRFGGRVVRTWEFQAKKRSPEIPRLLSRVMIRHDKAEVLPQLPPKTVQPVPVALADLLSKVSEIREVKRILDEAYQYSLDLDDQLLMDSMGKDPRFEEYSKLSKQLSLAKIPFVESLVEELEDAGEPVVLFGQHIDPIKEFGARPGWATIHGGVGSAERKQIEEEFQQGHYRGIALTIGAGKEALTLTRAREMIFIDQSFTPGDMSQAEDRIHRITQDSAVRIRYVLADHPLEKRRWEIVQAKQALIAQTIGKVSEWAG